MPFPWKTKKKKNRVTRISRIVADLQSPKRAGSLVVETGFPTSLIDLFVKNRSRFTKPKSNSKKPLQPQVFDPPPPSMPPISDTSSSCDFTAVPAEAPSVTPLDTAKVDGDDGGISGSGPGPGPEVNRVGECGCGSGSKSVLVVFLKMFVVVILIASVDKLTVGITMSAFALLLLENVGKRVVSCFKPCSDADMRIIKPLTQRVSDCVWLQNLRWKTKKNCDGSESEAAVGSIFVSELVVGDECSTNSLSFHGIEVVESNDEVFGPELSDCVNGEREFGCPEMLEGSNGKIVVDSSESKGSRRVWFKWMMVKKLVPKKLRSSKKERRERKSEESRAEEQENGITCRQESTTVARVDEEVSVVISENTNTNTDRDIGNSGYIIISILFVTALAGLIMGRFPALILTMTWCVILKSSIPIPRT